jgi:chromate transport protein ChrA
MVCQHLPGAQATHTALRLGLEKKGKAGRVVDFGSRANGPFGRIIGTAVEVLSFREVLEKRWNCCVVSSLRGE